MQAIQWIKLDTNDIIDAGFDNPQLRKLACTSSDLCLDGHQSCLQDTICWTSCEGTDLSESLLCQLGGWDSAACEPACTAPTFLLRLSWMVLLRGR